MKSEQDYVDEDGCFCPLCDSSDIESGTQNADISIITIKMNCHNCDLHWKEYYHLAGFEINDG